MAEFDTERKGVVMAELIGFSVWVGVSLILLFIAGIRDKNGQRDIFEHLLFAMFWPLLLFAYIVFIPIWCVYRLGQKVGELF